MASITIVTVDYSGYRNTDYILSYVGVLVTN